MAIKIGGKTFSPTVAAKKIVALSLPDENEWGKYLDQGGRAPGSVETTKLVTALKKQTERIKKLLGNP